jgi:hypothetical protein
VISKARKVYYSPLEHLALHALVPLGLVGAVDLAEGGLIANLLESLEFVQECFACHGRIVLRERNVIPDFGAHLLNLALPQKSVNGM